MKSQGGNNFNSQDSNNNSSQNDQSHIFNKSLERRINNKKKEGQKLIKQSSTENPIEASIISRKSKFISDAASGQSQKVYPMIQISKATTVKQESLLKP